jgi:pSer/pThr/pTyr-binding forkhead associated (FHA) protein
MPGRPSNNDGAEGDRAYQPDSGLDAKLDRAVPTSDAEAFLIGVGGSHGGRVYPLTHNTVLLGRDEQADVCVSDPSVSGQHARVINGSQGFEIEDLGSTNGTFIEGRAISRARLQGGDRITLGQVEFKFLIDRRVDATMTIIPAGLPVGSRREALIRYEPPRARNADSGAVPYAPAAPAKDEDEGPSFEDIIGRFAVAYRFVERNGRLLGFFAVVGALVGLISMILLPSPGEAICILKLQPQVKANPVDAQWNRSSTEGQEMRFFGDAEHAFIQPELVGETLKKLLGAEPSDAMVMSFTERLKLEPSADNTYRASYQEKVFSDGKPSATLFLKTHLETYLHGEINRAIRVFTAQADFLRDQLKSVETDMKRLSDEKMQFASKNSDRLPEEATQMLGSRFELESRRAQLVADVRKLQGDLDAKRRALAAEGPLSQNKYHASQVYRQSLAELNGKLSAAYARGLAEGHPEVIQLQEEKRRLEGLVQKEMASETSTLDRQSNAGYQDLQNQVALLQGQLSAARSDLADTDSNLGRVKGLVGDLPRVQAGVQQLTHMQEATTQLHGQLFEQLKKAELQLNLERVSAESRYEVLAPARLYRTGRLKTLVIRAGAGLVIGLFLAFATLLVRKIREILVRAFAKIDAGSTARR